MQLITHFGNLIEFHFSKQSYFLDPIALNRGADADDGNAADGVAAVASGAPQDAGNKLTE